MGLGQKRTTPPWQAVAFAVVLTSLSFWLLSFDRSPPLTLADTGGAVDAAYTSWLGAARAAFAMTHLVVLLCLMAGPGIEVGAAFPPHSSPVLNCLPIAMLFLVFSHLPRRR